MSPSFRKREELERLADALREGAREFRRAPPPRLRERVLAAVRARPGALPLAAGARPAPWMLAAAAVVLVAVGAFLWAKRTVRKTAPGQGPSVVLVSRELLGAGARVLALPREAEGNLRQEAKNLWLDTARAAEGLVRGLPAPLRAPLERL